MTIATIFALAGYSNIDLYELTWGEKL